MYVCIYYFYLKLHNRSHCFSYYRECLRSYFRCLCSRTIYFYCICNRVWLVYCRISYSTFFLSEIQSSACYVHFARAYIHINRNPLFSSFINRRASSVSAKYQDPIEELYQFTSRLSLLKTLIMIRLKYPSEYDEEEIRTFIYLISSVTKLCAYASTCVKRWSLII